MPSRGWGGFADDEEWLYSCCAVQCLIVGWKDNEDNYADEEDNEDNCADEDDVDEENGYLKEFI